jgi:hypothetical protein
LFENLLKGSFKDCSFCLFVQHLTTLFMNVKNISPSSVDPL